MSDFGTNDAEVIGIECVFPAEVHTKTGNSVEGWVLTAGDGRISPTGGRDTVAQDICGEATGDSGRTCGPTAYF